MAKMIKTAQGQIIDWDLMKIQTEASKNVAEPVDIVDQAAVAARRQQRARMEAARKLLDKAQQEAPTADEQPVKATQSTKKGKNA